MQKNEGLIKGWAFSERSNVVNVSVETGAANRTFPANLTSFCATRYARPDVQEKFKKEGLNVPMDSGFVARISARGNEPIRIRFSLEDGQVVTADHPVTNQVRAVADAKGDTKVIFGIDSLPSDGKPVNTGWRNQVMKSALDIYRDRLFWGVVLFLSATGFCLLVSRVLSGDKPALLNLVSGLLILSWIVCRLGFYAVIDAGAWGAEPRYVLVSGIFQCALAVIGVLTIFGRRP